MSILQPVFDEQGKKIGSTEERADYWFVYSRINQKMGEIHPVGNGAFDAIDYKFQPKAKYDPVSDATFDVDGKKIGDGNLLIKALLRYFD